MHPPMKFGYFYPMKFRFAAPVLLCLVFILASCKGEEKSAQNTITPSSVEYAKHFRFTEENGQRIMEILSPEDGKVERRIFKAEKEIKKIAALSSTHVGMIAKLDAEDYIVGISDKQYTYNPRILEQIEKGKIIELGESSQIPVERIIQSKTQAIVYSGFGKDFPHQKQLENIGIQCIPNYDWRELHPLGKAEWIKFFGFLLDKEEEAQKYFDDLVVRYADLKELALQAETKPSVMSGNMWGDNWHAPAGESFHAILLQDAQVDYVWANTEGTGSVFYPLEKVMADNAQTEYWINTGVGTMDGLLDRQGKVEFLNPVKLNRVYDYSNAGNYYWEEAAIAPDKVLSDYILLFHPALKPSEKFHFYHQVK